jgi:hypothetical protein
MKKIFLLACSLFLGANIVFASPELIPNTTVAMQNVQFWLTPEGEKIVAPPERVATMNKAMLSGTMCDLTAFPPSVSSLKLKEYLAHYTIDNGLYVNGLPLSDAYANELKKDAEAKILPTNSVKYGVVTIRSNLRSFPTLTGAFETPEDTYFDMWQETAVDPGEPALILHENLKGDFLFVQLKSYRGWLPRDQVAVTHRTAWLKYVEPREFAVVTGRILNIKGLIYQMGAKLPLVSGNLLVPGCNSQGCLITTAAPAVFNEELHKGYLPFTRNNLLRMAFKHLGAPYGWGGRENSVDCSAFVQDIYKTVGVQLPRNGDEQETAFTGVNMTNMNREERIQTIKALEPGSLMFTPYHVMLYLGEKNRHAYMIHAAGSYGARDGEGNVSKNRVMRVIVSDVELLGGSGTSLLLQMTKANNYK